MAMRSGPEWCWNFPGSKRSPFIKAGEAELVIEAGEAFEQRFPFTVIETGGFQQFVPVTLGTVEVPEIEPIGRISVQVRAKKMANSAVMDIQKVVLRKVSPDAPANGTEC